MPNGYSDGIGTEPLMGTFTRSASFGNPTEEDRRLAEVGWGEPV